MAMFHYTSITRTGKKAGHTLKLSLGDEGIGVDNLPIDRGFILPYTLDISKFSLRKGRGNT